MLRHHRRQFLFGNLGIFRTVGMAFGSASLPSVCSQDGYVPCIGLVMSLVSSVCGSSGKELYYSTLKRETSKSIKTQCSFSCCLISVQLSSSLVPKSSRVESHNLRWIRPWMVERCDRPPSLYQHSTPVDGISYNIQTPSMNKFVIK